MLPLATDNDVHGAIIRGMRRRRADIDLVRVHDAGLMRAPDPDILEWAAREGRILITEDVNTMVGYAWDRVNAGLPMPGVIVRGKLVPIRQAIDDLLLVAFGGAADDFKHQVTYLPL